MANNIDVTFSGDSKETERAYQRLIAQNEKLERRLEKLSQTSKRANRESGDGMKKNARDTDTAIQKLAKFTAGYGILRTAIGAAITEQEKLTKLQEAGRLAALTPAQAIRDARFNMTPDATLRDADLETVVGKLARETRSSQADVATVLASAFSAKGEMSNATAVDAVRQALRIKPGDPTQAAVIASRLLDTAKFSGSTDMRALAGFEANVQAAARVQDPARVGKNLIPSIGASVQFGDTPEQGAELLAAVTQLMQDETGERSATAFEQLGGQLKDFVPTRETKGKLKGRLTAKDPRGEFVIPDAQFEAFEKAKNTRERLKVLQESPELQRAFIGQSSFDQKAKQHMYSVIRGDDRATAAIKAAEDIIQPIGPEQAERFEAKIGRMEKGKLQPFLTTDQRVKSLLENQQLRNQRGLREAAARSAYTQLLATTDLPGWDALGETGEKFDLWRAERQNRADKIAPENAALGRLRKLREFVQTHGENTPGDIQRIDETIDILKEQRRSFGSPDSDLLQGISKLFQALKDKEDETRKNIVNSAKEQVEYLKRIADAVTQRRDSVSPPAQSSRPTSRISRTP